MGSWPLERWVQDVHREETLDGHLSEVGARGQVSVAKWEWVNPATNEDLRRYDHGEDRDPG